jgi:hypothetical protein
MRRKKKLGVYTGATIKSCYSDLDYTRSYCYICKSVCKAAYTGRVDVNSVSHSSDDAKSKLHKVGIGSLMPGRKFVPFCQKIHLGYRYSRYRAIKKALAHKTQKKKNVLEEVQYWNHLKTIELEAKKLMIYID